MFQTGIYICVFRRGEDCKRLNGIYLTVGQDICDPKLDYDFFCLRSVRHQTAFIFSRKIHATKKHNNKKVLTVAAVMHDDPDPIPFCIDVDEELEW